MCARQRQVGGWLGGAGAWEGIVVVCMPTVACECPAPPNTSQHAVTWKLDTVACCPRPGLPCSSLVPCHAIL